MGAWDASVFGNDDAADWGGDLADGDSEMPVHEVLREVAGWAADEYLESSLGSEALAAAEVVAAAAGRPTTVNAYNENVLAWATKRPSLAELAPVARNAVERVRAAESELAEEWEEAGDANRAAWSEAVENLLTRLI